MSAWLSYLSERRPVGVGLALAAEVCALVALSLAPVSGEAGIPGAVTTAIAGTVAVVFGVVDGVALALVGALVFGALQGLGVYELGPVLLWPGIVGAVGMFARRVDQRRILFQQLVNDQEAERRRIASELHDNKAQVLAGALMMLSASGSGTGQVSAATEQARELLNETIKALRALAADLNPRALEQYGLVAAVEQLANTLSENAGVSIQIQSAWHGRVSNEAELTLYRVVQEALAALIAQGEREALVTLEHTGDSIVVAIEHSRPGAEGIGEVARHALAERLRLLGGRLRALPNPAGGIRLQAELPAGPHLRADTV